jgi:beta-mannosidase
VAPDSASTEEFLVADTDTGVDAGAGGTAGTGGAGGTGGAEGLRAVHLPVADKDFAYPAPRFDVEVQEVPDGDGSVEVVVTAHTLVRDLLLQADRLGPDATCDAGLRTLLPGERVRLRLDSAAETGADAVRAAVFCVEPA